MKSLLITLLLGGLMASPAMAQTPDDTRPQEVEEDVVTATARTTRSDAAMAAWYAGDFVKAEIEFDKNQRCALRGVREFRSGVDGAANSAINAEVGVQGPDQVATAGRNRANFNSKDPETVAPRTCNDRPFDLYMRGLSQIKLGKFDEAKDSLTRSVALRKTNCDAYFRLALLEIQDGDRDKAIKRMKQLRNSAKKDKKRLIRKGKLCDVNETNMQLAYLNAALQ